MSIQNASKYIILPCSGIGKALGTIGRWAAYELADNLCPNTTRLLCLARFVVPDPDLLETITIKSHHYPRWMSESMRHEKCGTQWL